MGGRSMRPYVAVAALVSLVAVLAVLFCLMVAVAMTPAISGQTVVVP